MKFPDLFAGIDGFRLGMERAGHECVGFCEIDSFARKSYKAIYNTEGEFEFHDITAVTNEEWREFRGTVDIICGGKMGAVVWNGRLVKIRRLTPRECWRLQGFPDWAFERAQAVNSNSQLYKQAGNSVTVNVIEAIAKKLV